MTKRKLWFEDQDEFKSVLYSIPKDERNKVRVLMERAYILGIEEVKSLMVAVVDTRSDEIHQHCITHQDSIDGG